MPPSDVKKCAVGVAGIREDRGPFMSLGPTLAAFFLRRTSNERASTDGRWFAQYKVMGKFKRKYFRHGPEAEKQVKANETTR
jgi:hypothetical protein